MKSTPVKHLEPLESRRLLASGLTGQYFDNKEFTSFKFSRVDAQVNFNWAAAAPKSGMGSDTFSIRWTGQVKPSQSGSYKFQTTSDDGVRLWIDNKLVIDKLVNGSATTYTSPSINLTAGKAVNVRLDYYENTGSASVKLLWGLNGGSMSLIPSANLLSTVPPSPPPPPPPTSGTIRIDAAGSKSFIDSDGKTWSADKYYSGGSLSLGSFAINGTDDDALYYTRRYGKNFTYSIPLASGKYKLKLFFADESYNAGGRKFDVFAEGRTILDNFDIVAAGGKNNIVSRTFDVAVSDGALNLAFAGVLNNATLSAIEITPAPTTPDPVTTVSWKSVAPSPVVRAEASGATVDGKLYVFGGYKSENGQILAQYRCDVYDPQTNHWTQLADMPNNFSHCGVAVDGTTIWLVGQYTGDHPGPGSTEVWKYNTTNDTWSRGPDLPEKRGAGAAAIVGRELHYFGGMDETRTYEQGEHWVLDLDNQSAGWVAQASLPNARNHLGGAAVGGKIYAIGGQYGQEAEQVAQSDVHCYDPATDQWTKVASLPGPRSHLCGDVFAVNGKIIVLGGETSFLTQTNTVYCYDPATDKWTQIGMLPQKRSSVVSGVISDDQFIMSTGNNPDATNNTWIATLS